MKSFVLNFQGAKVHKNQQSDKSTINKKKEALSDSLFRSYEDEVWLFFHNFLDADDIVPVADGGEIDAALQVPDRKCGLAFADFL